MFWRKLDPRAAMDYLNISENKIIIIIFFFFFGIVS